MKLKKVVITAEGCAYVHTQVARVKVLKDGTVIIYAHGIGIVRALGPGQWDEISVIADEENKT